MKAKDTIMNGLTKRQFVFVKPKADDNLLTTKLLLFSIFGAILPSKRGVL